MADTGILIVYNMENSNLLVPFLPKDDLCPICFSNNLTYLITPCSHYFCIPCLSLYLQIKITEGQVLKIQCPSQNCPTLLTQNQIESLISKDLFEKYRNFHSKFSLESNINFRWCPQKNCEGFAMYTSSNLLTCNHCSYEFCFLCAESWHFGKKCLQDDSFFLNWAKKKKVKKCPNCKMNTEKAGGCSHITCTKCSIDWCWLCGNSKDGHSELQCFAGKNIMDLHWSAIFFAIFLPILVPFAMPVMFIFTIYQENIEEDVERQNRWESFIAKNKILVIVLLVFISPPVTLLWIACSLLIIGFAISVKYAPDKYNKNLCWGLFLLVFIFTGAGVTIAVVSAALVVGICIIPIIGILLLLCKLIYLAFFK